jgi:hypothetical protein
VLPLIRKTREQLVSDVNFRRILGLLQILPFAFGLYSNFYFLGGSKIGWLFVQRIFLEETITVRWPFLLLIFLGYFYMQVAMEVDMKINYANRCPVKCPVAMNGTVQNGKKKD